MTLLEAILLGIVQGITEFLPVSSSGHLTIAYHLLQIDSTNQVLYEVMLHIGSVFALLIVFQKDILRMLFETIQMIKDLFYNLSTYFKNQGGRNALRYHKIIHNNYRKFVLLVLISSAITGFLGVAMNDLVEVAVSTYIVPGICLLITGIVLLVTDLSEGGNKIPKNTSYFCAVIIGVVQGIAVLPGLSRAGITICACLLLGFDKKFAIKYSFILSIPAILGAMIYEMRGVSLAAYSSSEIGICFAGMAVAGIVGYYAVRYMLRAIRRKRFRYFAYYCFIIGALSIVLHILS